MSFIGKGNREAALADLRKAVKLQPNDMFINALLRFEKAQVTPATPPATRAVKPANTEPKLSQAEIDGLRARLKQNWSLPVGEPQDLVIIKVKVALKPDGSIAVPPAVLTSTNKEKLVESIILALYASQPFDMLLREHYDGWKEMILTFHRARKSHAIFVYLNPDALNGRP
jgi:hypothetical protein